MKIGLYNFFFFSVSRAIFPAWVEYTVKKLWCQYVLSSLRFSVHFCVAGSVKIRLLAHVLIFLILKRHFLFLVDHNATSQWKVLYSLWNIMRCSLWNIMRALFLALCTRWLKWPRVPFVPQHSLNTTTRGPSRRGAEQLVSGEGCRARSGNWSGRWTARQFFMLMVNT